MSDVPLSYDDIRDFLKKNLRLDVDIKYEDFYSSDRTFKVALMLGETVLSTIDVDVPQKCSCNKCDY